MIEYRCPRCRAKMSSPSSLIGQQEPCPNCGLSQTVPGVQFQCLRCKDAMVADLARVGTPMRCDRCGLIQSIPPTPNSTDAIEQIPSSLSGKSGIRIELCAEPATDRQINYARAIGLQFEYGITKDQIGLLLTYYERARHYLYGLWLHLADESATANDDSKEFVKVYAAAVVNQDKGVAREIHELVGDDGHSEEFLFADVDLRDALARDFMLKFSIYAGRSFSRR